MTKKEMIDLINQFDDDAEFTFPTFWERSDVENDDQPLTDREWFFFQRWFEKFSDASFDYNEALHYATTEAKKEMEQN